MRKKLIIGNWKMNMTNSEAKSLLNALKLTVDTKNKDVAVAVPFTDMSVAFDILKDTEIALAAQNMHYATCGAYTGEISAEMLKDFDVKYSIIGHSERRTNFYETDEIVNKKIKCAIENNIIPVVCVGETLEERNENIHLDKIKMQVKNALLDIDEMFITKVVIAYEPLWAIGTGLTAKKEEAEEICSFIRYTIAEKYGIDASENTRILYGGSVNEENAKEILSMPNIDGALVGGASLKASFKDVINAV